MNNKLLSQITTFTNVEKEKISYLNYSPPTIDDSSSDMSCKFISCLMLFVRVRILCSVIIIASILFFSRGTCILDGLRKMLQNTKVDDFK